VLQHQKTQLVTNVLGDEGFASSLGMDDLAFILGTGGLEEELAAEDESSNDKESSGGASDLIDVSAVKTPAKKAAKKTAKKAAKKAAKKSAKK
jgi:hypothetical protein